MWLVPLEDLSEDQHSAVVQDYSRNRVIIGGPGSGKTLVLAHRASACMKEHAMPRDRVRVLVYTQVLRDYIKVGLADLGLEDICMTFDKWVSDELAAAGLGWPRGKDPFARAHERLLQHLRSHPGRKRWDALLVDEGQDLDADSIEILRLSAEHVTLALDSRQRLYDTGSSESEACGALGLKRPNAMLLSAYRCTPAIVRVGAEFLPSDDLRHQFRRANLMPISQHETPVIMRFKTLDDELDVMAPALQERAFANQTSAVLVTNKNRVAQVARGLEDRGIEVRTHEDHDPDLSKPLVVTYHSAKGLTVDSVFLARVTGTAFKNIDDERARRMLFVGITRATHWVWIGTIDPMPKLLDGLQPLIAEGIIKDATGVVQRPKIPAYSSPPPDHDDLLDLL